MKDLVSQIMDFESGDMDQDEIPVFFQELINSGLAFQLQGFYGRTAVDLIESGVCTPRETTA